MKRVLRISEVTEATGLSRTSIWRRERAGTFPARVRLGDRAVGWRSNEIEAWIRGLERAVEGAKA